MARIDAPMQATRAVRILLVAAVVVAIVVFFCGFALVRIGQSVRSSDKAAQSSRGASDQASEAARQAKAASEANGQVLAQVQQVLTEIKTVGAYLVECTTPGQHEPTADDPTSGHPCYDQSTERTADAVKELARRQDCIAIYVVLKESPLGCADVIERIEILRGGGRL